MNTPISNRPLLTAFRSKYRPKLAKNQHDLSSFLVSPDVTNRHTLGESLAGGLPSALERTGWSYRVEHAVNEIIRDHNTYQQDPPIRGQTYRMFDAALSTSVLLASGETNISVEHLVWSEAFLRGIRDRYGNHPPNVRKILGFIKHIWTRQAANTSSGSTSNDVSDLFVRTYHDNVPQNVTLTKIHPPSGNATV